MFQKLKNRIKEAVDKHKERRFVTENTVSFSLEITEYKGSDCKPKYTLLAIFPLGSKFNRIVHTNANIDDIRSELKEIFEIEGNGKAKGGESNDRIEVQIL